METLTELLELHDLMKKYLNLPHEATRTAEIIRIRESNVGKSVHLKEEITKLTLKRYFEKWGKEYEVWDTAFSQLPKSGLQCEAIGLLEAGDNVESGRKRPL